MKMSASKTLRLLSKIKPATRNLTCCQMFSSYLRLPRIGCKPEPVFKKSLGHSFVSNVKQLSVIFNTKHSIRYKSSARFTTTAGHVDEPLTKLQAGNLVLRLTEDERNNLFDALQEFEANSIKSEYEAENVPEPNLNQLMTVAIHNAVPFVGFGFLDNFIMIVAGDYIELSLGSFITISTMAAAALGNTISDVMGIGSAWYVEMLATRIGLKSPNLSPIQLDMKSARRFANLGRAIGIVIGCLLGMIPLLFMNTESAKSKETSAQIASS